MMCLSLALPNLNLTSFTQEFIIILFERGYISQTTSLATVSYATFREAVGEQEGGEFLYFHVVNSHITHNTPNVPLKRLV
jgi:hypothetical protein